MTSVNLQKKEKKSLQYSALLLKRRLKLKSLFLYHLVHITSSRWLFQITADFCIDEDHKANGTGLSNDSLINWVKFSCPIFVHLTTLYFNISTHSCCTQFPEQFLTQFLKLNFSWIWEKVEKKAKQQKRKQKTMCKCLWGLLDGICRKELLWHSK